MGRPCTPCCIPFMTRSDMGAKSATSNCWNSFVLTLASAGIADRYQYELYLRQGMEQLRQFLECARSAPAPEVLETERQFEMQVGAAKVTGRVDRIDSTGPETVAIVDYKTGKPKIAGGCRREPTTFAVCAGGERGIGKTRRSLIFHNLENNSWPSPLRGTTLNWKRRRLRVQKAAEELRKGSLTPNSATSARFARIAISVRRRRRGSPHRRKNPARTATRESHEDQDDFATKNFGDAHRVPFVVACCSCLVLFAAFLLCFLFGCHGSILPFHSSWNFATVFCCN